MKRSIYPAILIISAFMILQSCGGNNTQNSTHKAKPDTLGAEFLKGAIEGGLTEIKASELASTHSQNPRVTDFAKMMISDHSKANDTLRKIETNNALTGNDVISPAHNQNIDNLSKKSGADFDKAYIKTMIKDHEGAVLLFVRATQAGDSTIRIFAKQTLPLIQMHLDSAKKINIDLK